MFEVLRWRRRSHEYQDAGRFGGTAWASFLITRFEESRQCFREVHPDDKLMVAASVIL